MRMIESKAFEGCQDELLRETSGSARSPRKVTKSPKNASSRSLTNRRRWINIKSALSEADANCLE